LRPIMMVSRVELAWGFSVRYAGLSAAQPSLPLPPPSTVIGFYAEPLARLLGLPEYGLAKHCSPAGLLARHTLAAAAGLDPESPVAISVHSDVTRVLSLPYQRKRRDWEPYAWSVQALGAAYGPGARLYLGIVVDAEGLARETGVDAEELAEPIARAGWRLGSKEGLVSVLESYVGEPETIERDFSSIFYQEGGMVTPVTLEAVRIITMWRPGLGVFCGESIQPEYREYFVPTDSYSTHVLLFPPSKPVVFKPRGSAAYCLDTDRGLCIAAKGA